MSYPRGILLSPKSKKQVAVEQNNEQITNRLLQGYTNLLQHFSKNRVDLAGLQMDAEIMASMGSMTQAELDKINIETKQELKHTEDMDTLENNQENK